MAVRGITRRWLLNSISLIILILAIIVLLFSSVIKDYYYSEIQQEIDKRSNDLVSTLSTESLETSARFEEKIQEYIQNFPDKKLMELIVFNSNDKVLITSEGFELEENENMPDYNIAKSSSNGYGTWTGKLLSDEKVMAVTRCIYNSSGDYLGSVRYIVSLEAAKKSVVASVIILSVVGIVFMSVIAVYSSYFIRSIVSPLYDMGTIANRIARGDFDARIEKKHNDEIGELCDIINYMAGELSASEKLKNDFISSVSHELRTPLTAIKGWAETMQMGGSIDSKTMDRGLKIIVSESERLSGIVEELLDFSRMQNGRMVLMMDKIDLLAEVDEAVYMLKDRAKSEEKELVYEAPHTVSPVLGDKNRLRQVFINIIDNAIKYTNSGGSILVNVYEEDDNIKVTITDNGCGIPAEHLPRVKEKFYKANQTQGGSGIGLAVANEIMLLHSGRLEISSQEGVGTVVTLLVPKMKTDNVQL